MRTLSEFRAAIRRRAQDRTLRKAPSRFAVALFDSIHHVDAAAWDAIVPPARVFLRRHYLAALEVCEPHDIAFRYALLFDGRRPVAAAAVQVVEMSGASVGSRAQPQDATTSTGGIVGKVRRAARRAADKLEARLMVCGNAFVSGDHGFAYVDDVDPRDVHHGLAEALYRMRRADKLSGDVAALLVKDFPVDGGDEHPADELERFGYRRFDVDPSMVVQLRGWRTFDDYLAAMTGKYRRRVKSARKKGALLRRRALTASELETHADRLHELLENVAEKASFRIASHPRRYYPCLRAALGEDLQVTVYELDDRIVGFRSTIAAGEVVEGHYLGIDYDHNTAHGVYQNMLYDYVDEALARGAKVLALGRTAMEIKSAMGAVAQPMRCYIRHRSPVGNRVVKPLFRFAKPTSWTPRNPFS